MRFFPRRKGFAERTTWRDYQEHLKNKRCRGFRKRTTFLKFILFVLVIMASGYGLIQQTAILAEQSQSQAVKPIEQIITSLGDNQARNLLASLDEKDFLNLRQPIFTTQFDGETYQVKTSIDPRLQEALLSEVEEMTAQERYRSRFIGIVVMEAETGKILSMVSYDKENSTHNNCVNDQFPAASIFKIITAAAAIDIHGLTGDSRISYSGQKHTLYRGQLKSANKNHSHMLSLKDSFAQSVNPVFGKIGAELLGKEEIEDYAARFGFNKTIDSDILIEPSHVAVGDEPFNQAEIASGFNMQTTISPLHGAMIARTVLNDGQMKIPTIVDRIIGPQNRIIYERVDNPPQRVISEKTSKELNRMMQATISSGTAHKMFKDINRNEILRDLSIGAKTGSINNDPRFDWFIGFAENSRTHYAITVSAVVVHEKFIGERAGEYAILAMKTFFSNNATKAFPTKLPPSS